jgi:hypothetical protein
LPLGSSMLSKVCKKRTVILKSKDNYAIVFVSLSLPPSLPPSLLTCQPPLSVGKPRTIR